MEARRHPHNPHSALQMRRKCTIVDKELNIKYLARVRKWQCVFEGDPVGSIWDSLGMENGMSHSTVCSCMGPINL